jgi:hypothetical protein
LGLRKKTELYCLSALQEKDHKKTLRTKPPNGQQKYPEKQVGYEGGLGEVASVAVIG